MTFCSQERAMACRKKKFRGTFLPSGAVTRVFSIHIELTAAISTEDHLLPCIICLSELAMRKKS